METSEKKVLIPEELDHRHVDLHTDCVAFDFATRIIAVTCYELNETDPSQSTQKRAGKVYFYLLSPNSNGQDVLFDLKVKYNGISDLLTSLPCPAGVFDIRWSQRPLGDASPTSLMGLALSDGTFRQFKVSIPFSSLAAFNASLHARSPPDSISVEDFTTFHCEMEGDLALGVDKSRIYDQSDLSSDPEDEFQSDANEPSSGTNCSISSSEHAAIGYQSGAISVFDITRGLQDPIWSCPDAHLAEVWQTQWIHDATYDPFIKTSIEGHTCTSSSMAYGRKMSNLFVSGSDDASFKIWDVRRDPSSGPVATNRKHFQMGVTSFASPLASSCQFARSLLPFNLLVGSYDESLSLWDIRNITKPIDSISLGGGVWRLRWLPTLSTAVNGVSEPHCEGSSATNDEEASYLAVATMHAGFKVVRIAGINLSEAKTSTEVSTTRFEEISCYWGPHKGSNDGKFPPLAYGLDWAVPAGSRFDTKSGASLVACTFYDNCISSWRL